ncbi:UNKNOWN [Stylonychia lemnae]|uniref:Uncharacterized protein n=1 Tax=Stylonychia lemnae TaxID=5949 RepID=A0A078B1A9_STYLE|nr:UNKNOWN [Stylonychia lemnae]|eukprot:CDW87142.1 UNKNOWN [Stylonychia lemnae]
MFKTPMTNKHMRNTHGSLESIEQFKNPIDLDETEFTHKLRHLPEKIEQFKTLFLNKKPKFLKNKENSSDNKFNDESQDSKRNSLKFKKKKKIHHYAYARRGSRMMSKEQAQSLFKRSDSANQSVNSYQTYNGLQRERGKSLFQSQISSKLPILMPERMIEQQQPDNWIDITLFEDQIQNNHEQSFTQKLPQISLFKDKSKKNSQKEDLIPPPEIQYSKGVQKLVSNFQQLLKDKKYDLSLIANQKETLQSGAQSTVNESMLRISFRQSNTNSLNSTFRKIQPILQQHPAIHLVEKKLKKVQSEQQLQNLKVKHDIMRRTMNKDKVQDGERSHKVGQGQTRQSQTELKIIQKVIRKNQSENNLQEFIFDNEEKKNRKRERNKSNKDLSHIYRTTQPHLKEDIEPQKSVILDDDQDGRTSQTIRNRSVMKSVNSNYNSQNNSYFEKLPQISNSSIVNSQKNQVENLKNKTKMHFLDKVGRGIPRHVESRKQSTDTLSLMPLVKKIKQSFQNQTSQGQKFNGLKPNIIIL